MLPLVLVFLAIAAIEVWAASVVTFGHNFMHGYVHYSGLLRLSQVLQRSARLPASSIMTTRTPLFMGGRFRR